MSSYSLRCSVHSALTTAVAELAAPGSTGFAIGGVAPWTAADEALASGFTGAALARGLRGRGFGARVASAWPAVARERKRRAFASVDGEPSSWSRASIACKRGRQLVDHGLQVERQRLDAIAQPPQLDVARARLGQRLLHLVERRPRPIESLVVLLDPTVEASSPRAAKANSAKRRRKARRRRNESARGEIPAGGESGRTIGQGAREEGRDCRLSFGWRSRRASSSRRVGMLCPNRSTTRQPPSAPRKTCGASTGILPKPPGMSSTYLGSAWPATRRASSA